MPALLRDPAHRRRRRMRRVSLRSAVASGPSQSCIQLVQSIPLEVLARYKNMTISKRTPTVVAAALADAIDASMIGLDAPDTADRVTAWRIHLFAARVLRGPVRGGRKKNGTVANAIRVRVERFMKGDWGELWSQVKKRGPRQPTTDAQLEEQVTALVREGLSRKAVARLDTAPMAPATEATHAALAALNPDGAETGPMPIPAAPPAPPQIDPETFLDVVTNVKLGVAAGPSGW